MLSGCVRNPDIRRTPTQRRFESRARCQIAESWADFVYMIRSFLRFLIAEFLVGAMAGVLFAIISEKRVAGFIAGIMFVALGLWIVTSPLRTRALIRSGTFWIGLVYLLFVALPLMVTRFVNVSLQFEEVRIMGFSGPEFHRISTSVYTVLIVATSIDLALAWFFARKKRATKSTK